MTGGRLIAVVGPSGVGKDSVIAGLARAAPELVPVRRAITRPAEPGGEDHEPLSVADFSARRDGGAFCLHWGAHGLFYGIPAGILPDVAAGAQRLVNLSRGVLGQAADLCPALVVLHVTAAPQTLALRLAGRGRESAGEIRRRLARADACLPSVPDIRHLANDGPLEETVARALALLQPVRG